MTISQEELNNIIKNYVDLIILQYADKPNAAQQIEDYVDGLLSDGLLFKLRDAFDVETAIGKQLDIIGKYVGVDRNGEQFAVDFDQNLFSTVDTTADLTPAAFGTVSEVQFPVIDSHILNNDDFSTSTILDDDNYRFVIKLKIIQNNINHSESAIDSAVNEVFQGLLFPSGVDGKMFMTYIADQEILSAVRIAFNKDVLPRPTAVGLPYIVAKPIGANLFGFATNGTNPNFVSGFEIGGNEGGKALFNGDLIFS